MAPQVGKVIQGTYRLIRLKLPPHFSLHRLLDLLKLSDETDLDILNHCMEAMVDHFQTQLLPVAAQLAPRLVPRL